MARVLEGLAVRCTIIKHVCVQVILTLLFREDTHPILAHGDRMTIYDVGCALFSDDTRAVSHGQAANVKSYRVYYALGLAVALRKRGVTAKVND